MKPHSMIRYLTAIIIVGLSFAFTRPVLAASAPPAPTILKLSPLRPQIVGNTFTIYATLMTASGDPIHEGSIAFYANKDYLGRARLQEDGSANLQVRTQLKAGNYLIRAEYGGTRLASPAQSGQSLSVNPAFLKVQTVPPVQGVTFKLNGNTYLSDKQGLATIPVEENGKYRLEVVTETANDENTHVSFGRWMDESFAPYRDITVPRDDSLQVGLSIEHKVSLSFIDREGDPVPPERISAISLKNIHGDTYNLENGQARFLPGSKVARRLGGLEVTHLQYSVMSVTVDGSNVVNQAQQRFYTSPGDNWQISLLLFSAQISAQDAFFKFPVGKGVILTYPNEDQEQLSFEPDNQVTVTGLARGIYHVAITGVTGYAPATPVALSQDQVVNLVVLTWIDLLTLGLAGAALAIGLLYIGRPELFRQGFQVVTALPGRLFPAPKPVKSKRHRHRNHRTMTPVAAATLHQPSQPAPATLLVRMNAVISKARTLVAKVVSNEN